ncbi:glutamine amidotransferase [Marinobacter nauticus]|uniref:GMP synthase n=1 Tax=Marinobacter nauticus TaxID=2743 RepID=A0A1M2V0B6_MARNT|nr:glutamine amidotransferase [Marinobacter nauticus]OJT01024.1 GMP synthase [Marinobacter nauticus]
MAGTQTPHKARVVILKTGSTYPQIRDQFGDFDAWFSRALSSQLELTIADVTQAPPPVQPGDWQGIVITGSPAMVSERAAWSETTAAWVRQAVEAGVPLLGVCYGHQLLAHALGGKVDYHPDGRETGTQAVTLFDSAQDDPLFSQLPKQFPAHLTHKQSVIELPPGAVLLGRSAFEPHQAFRVGKNAWGVQFHPEFNEQIMKAYLEVQYPDLESEGLDANALLSSVQPAPAASQLLRLFADWVIKQQH